MLLCLSSGFTPRYRQDILRAISMPVGSILRFRYDLELVNDSLKEKIKNNNLGGEDVCIAYLDRTTDVSKDPEIIPCRAAQIRASSTLGGFCILDLEIKEFWVTQNITSFNNAISNPVHNLPKRRGSNLIGEFCLPLAHTPSSLIKTENLVDWQSLVTELRKRKDFESERFFYFMRGVFESVQNKRVKISQDAYNISSGRDYEINILQFSPGETNEVLSVKDSAHLLLDTDRNSIEFLTNEKLQVDSGYDEKKIRLRATSVNSETHSLVSVYRHTAASAPEKNDAIWDFDLLFRVSPRRIGKIIQGGLIGIFLSAQGLAIVIANSQIQQKILVSSIVVVASFAAGLMASFGIRKP